jgi:chorismate dehydratase
VDAALLPSIEFARMREAVEAGGFGISSWNEVRSVVLLSRAPVQGVRSVAVDVNSRTSVALLMVLLARRFGARPEILPMPPDPTSMLGRCEAALLIGDAALRVAREGLLVLDLAAAWHELTGLPFVFALWAARNATAAARAASLLESALALGEAHLADAASPASAAAGLPVEVVFEYLTRNVHFRVGAEERRSLDLFFTMCREDGLLVASPDGGSVDPAHGSRARPALSPGAS